MNINSKKLNALNSLAVLCLTAFLDRRFGKQLPSDQLECTQTRVFMVRCAQPREYQRLIFSSVAFNGLSALFIAPVDQMG